MGAYDNFASAVMNQVATSSDFEVLSKSCVFDPRPNLPFRVTAKRYWMNSDPEELASTKQPLKTDDDVTQSDALTLIFAHAASFHKEHWEPVIRRLFEQQQRAGKALRIQDMWALDAPNHGDAAVINEEILAFGYRLFSTEDYARCIHAFLAGLGSGVDVDFSKRKLVAVGHSMGGAAIITSTTYFPQIKFSSMYIIEPIFLGNYEPHDFNLQLARHAESRRDIWKSANDAYEVFKSRPPWRNWDDRTLRIYVKHGLRSLPTAEYPDGVTLKCTKKQEAATYRDDRTSAIAYRLLPHILKNIPTHITYGQRADLLRAEWRADVLNNASGGIEKFSGVTWVPDAGHLVVQTHPDAIADIVCKSLLPDHLNGRLRDAIIKARL